ncbi:hypothetical protein BDR06DRAFT_981565 [Suillus hirtellus]|nr:hypothetical protein BDR06DRAFT_981565 [Suillus hirtellus]
MDDSFASSSYAIPAGYSTICKCGRSFAQLNAYANHQRTCRKRKKYLSNALVKAKEVWTARKRPCREDERDETAPSLSPTWHDLDTATPGQTSFIGSEQDVCGPSESSHSVDDSGLLAQHILPQPPPPHMAESTLSSTTDHPPTSDTSSLLSHTLHFFVTLPNTFGLSRRYYGNQLPTHDPEEVTTLENLTLTPLDQVSWDQNTGGGDKNLFYPYPNKSSFLLGDWFWNGGLQKSHKSFRELLQIIEDISAMWWNLINDKLGSSAEGAGRLTMPFEGAGWKKTAINIKIPIHKRVDNPGVHDYLTADFFHRSLVSVIREKLKNQTHDKLFHYQPYELLWNGGPSKKPTRVHGELYTSEAFIEVHCKLQESQPEPGCELERVIVALMFWLDLTHLTSFGNSKLWPCYMFFGNESKYRRCKPSCRLCNHVAYFNHLPDSFKDFATSHFGGKGPGADFMAHCHRELFHEQWKIMLDDEFLEACKHSIVICCCDGIERCFYPWIFTYSADYPEKALLAMIWTMGGCPCSRCLIPKSHVQNLGMSLDIKQCQMLARLDDNVRQDKVAVSCSHIYDRGYGVCSNVVENILKEHSLVPTSNAFSERLGCLGFNLFIMLVVDLMHEFELGVWKALFTHLIHILSAAHTGDALVHELDRRYRLTPTFGHDTIRKFSSNASEMKKMGARDFEDLLQCAIPAFEGLLPEPYNRDILTLLFTCAHWHALAKLRMHTDETLVFLDAVTVKLGKQLHQFQKDTCIAFKTRELRWEAEHRQCQQSRSHVGEAEVMTIHQSTWRLKTFNLQTYKLHALGDYSTSICKFGTTDSYSTEPITHIEQRQACIHHICNEQAPHCVANEEEVATSPEAHFHIGKSQNYPKNITLFLQRNLGDPAVKDFLPKLQRFLLPKIKEILTGERRTTSTPASSDSEGRVFIKADRMYRHNLMCLNHTMYDVRRAQDIINPSTSHCNIMLLGQAGATTNLEYSLLDRACFLPMAEPDAFGFVDPSDVLRGCHIIPQFSQGLWHSDGKGVSNYAQDKLDWKSYYINRFIDRDMFMRYHLGLGVGHTYADTSREDTDTTVVNVEDFEDFEAEGEVTSLQDCGTDSEVSDSDSGSDSGNDSEDSEQCLDYDEYDTLDYEN